MAVRVAYDAACDVLLRYAPALESARDGARVAYAVTAGAQEQRLGLLVSGGLLGSAAEAELARGAALAARAEQDQALAAGVAVSALRDLAALAPPPRPGANRFASQALTGLRDALLAPAELAATAWGALPSVGSSADRVSARRELRAQAEAMVQPWMAVEQMLQQVRDGQGGAAFGAAAGMAFTHKFGVKAKDARLFGTHGALDDAVMRAVRNAGTDVAEGAWILEREQRLLLQDLLRLYGVRLPSAEELLSRPVDLQHHEAHGGHTILKHVGRDVAFLRRRQDSMGGDSRPEVSSFAHLRDAEAAVTAVLEGGQNARLLREWARSGRPGLELTLTDPLAGLATVVATDGSTGSAEVLVVRLKRLPSGSICINTVFARTRRAKP